MIFSIAIESIFGAPLFDNDIGVESIHPYKSVTNIWKVPEAILTNESTPTPLLTSVPSLSFHT